MTSAKAQEALDIGRKFIAAMSSKDPEGVVALLHDDVVLEFPFPVRAGENVTGSRRQFGKVAHASVRASVGATEKIQFNNVVWRTTDDGLAMLQADGECVFNGGPYCNHYIFLFEVADGKIVRWWEYLNPVISARSAGIALDSMP